MSVPRELSPAELQRVLPQLSQEDANLLRRRYGLPEVGTEPPPVEEPPNPSPPVARKRAAVDPFQTLQDAMAERKRAELAAIVESNPKPSVTYFPPGEEAPDRPEEAAPAEPESEPAAVAEEQPAEVPNPIYGDGQDPATLIKGLSQHLAHRAADGDADVGGGEFRGPVRAKLAKRAEKTDEQEEDEALNLLVDATKHHIKDQEDALVAAVQESKGSEPTAEERAAARAQAVNTVSKTNAFNYDGVIGPAGEVYAPPGWAPGEKQYNLSSAVVRYGAALERRYLKQWAADNPGKKLSAQDRADILARAKDQAKRDVFSVVGTDPTRENPLVPLDPIEAQVERIREGAAYGGGPGLIASAYELATGARYEDSAISKAFAPFDAALSPGFSESELVDEDGKRLGAPAREAWYSSATRSPITSPFATYLFDERVKEWGDDAHMTALAEGRDITAYPVEVGEWLTPDSAPTLVKGGVGLIPVAVVSILDPDLPSIALGGASEVFKIGRSARKVIAASNADTAEKMAKALSSEGEALEGGAEVVDESLDQYLAVKREALKGTGPNVHTPESQLVDYTEQAARARLASEANASIAPELRRAEDHAELLRAAQVKVAKLEGEYALQKDRMLSASDAIDSEISKNVISAKAGVGTAAGTLAAIDQGIPGAVRTRNLLEAAQADAKADDAIRRASTMVERAKDPVAKWTSEASRVAGRSLKKEGAAAEEASSVAAVARDRRKEWEATKELVEALRADAKAAAKRAADKLNDLRAVAGRDATSQGRLEAIIERSKTLKQRRLAVDEAIAEIERIAPKDRKPLDAQDLTNLRRQRAAINRESFVDIADGEIAAAYERWRVARGSAVASASLASDLAKRLDFLDRKIVSTVNAAERQAAKATSVVAKLSEKKARDLAFARKRFAAADAALSDAVLRSRDVVGRAPGALNQAVKKANAAVERIGKARAKAAAELKRAEALYEDVVLKPFAYLRSNAVRAAFAEHRRALKSLSALYPDLKKAETNARGLPRYKQILREEFQKTAEAFRAYEKWAESGEVPAEAARAGVLLDTAANRGNDALLGRSPVFSYGWTSDKGLAANMSRILALATMRSNARLFKFFDAVSARGFGPLSGEVRLAAERNFGRFRSTVYERNEIAKANNKIRKTLNERGVVLMDELRRGPTPARRQQIVDEMDRLQQQLSDGDVEYLTSGVPIRYGKGDGTVSNVGIPHADRALEYLRLIRGGEAARTDVVYQALVRAWMPSGYGVINAENVEPAARAILDGIIDGSRTGAELVQKLRGNALVAPWLSDVADLESRMKAWDNVTRALLSGSCMRDGLFDLVKATGTRFTAAEAKMFDVLASEPAISVAKTADKAVAEGHQGAAEVIASLEAKVAKYGTGVTEQMVTAWRPMGKSSVGQLRLMKLGSANALGGEVYIPEHVYRAMQEIPEKIVKQTTQWDMDRSPAISAARKWMAARKLSMVYGLWVPRLRQYFVQPIGDFSSAATHIGVGNAARILGKTSVSGIPFIGDKLAALIEHALGPKSILGSTNSVDLDRVMKADSSYFLDTAEGRISGIQLLREAYEDRMWSGMGTDALMDVAEKTFSGMRKQKRWQKLFDSVTEPNRFVEAMADQLEELQKRSRVRTYLEHRTGRITGTPVSREVAKKATLEALFDWQMGTLPWENEGLFRLLIYWNYRRNSIKHMTGLVTEPFLEPTSSYLRRAAIGQTKLGKTTSFLQVSTAAINAAGAGDASQPLDDHQAFLAWGESEYPTWAGSVGLMTKDALTGSESQWYLEHSGKKVTHEAWSTANLQMFDNLHALHDAWATFAASAVWAAEAGGAKPRVTHSDMTVLARRWVERATDFIDPFFAPTVQAALEHLAGQDSRTYESVPVTQDTVLAANALGLGEFLYTDNSGRAVMDGFMFQTMSTIAEGLLPQYREFVSTIAATSNPAYQESIAEGLTESIGRILGVWRRNVFNPGDQRAREERAKKGQLGKMANDADPLTGR